MFGAVFPFLMNTVIYVHIVYYGFISSVLRKVLFLVLEIINYYKYYFQERDFKFQVGFW